MEYVYLILKMLGGMGCFLVGMEIMSESMSRLAHGSLKNMLNKTANSRLAGVGIGTAVTAIIQSSAATTVMVVGLVNAGIMTLFQATAIIMGANIGTTITAWIASLGTIDISKFFFLLAVIGAFMMMLCKKDNVKTIGSILAGLGLIFVGLAYMSESMGNDLIKDAITPVFEAVKNPVLLVIVGAVVTALIQSSSAVTSIIIVLASSGIIVGGTGDGVYFVIIGSNIGTCVTALLSSIGATENARRAAVIHLLFNCFGAIIFSFFLLGWKWAGSSFTGVVLDRIFPPMPSGEPNYQFQIAFFHTLFNVICTCIFLPFAKGFVWLANRIVREKKKKPQKKFKHNPLLAPAYRPFLYLERIETAIASKQFNETELLGYAYASAVDAIQHHDDAPMRRTAEIFHMSEQEFIERGQIAFNNWLRMPSFRHLG